MSTTTAVARIQVRYFAGAKAALGRGEETRELAPGETIESLLGALGSPSGSALSPAAIAVLGRCSFILNGVATTERRVPLQNGDRLDVLPPFAGG
jgi:molybdopterin converting factor small subunit